MFQLTACSGWNEEAFVHSNLDQLETGASAKQMAAAISKAVSSRLFWAYAHFLCIVAGAVEQQSSWCEACSCHEDMMIETTNYKRRIRIVSKALRHAAGRRDHDQNPREQRQQRDALIKCPLKGRRAHDFAAGAFEAFTAEVMTVCKSRVVATALRVEGQDRAKLMEDYCTAADVVVSTIALKTAHWGMLPWKLCGLACDDPEVARKLGRDCLELFTTASSSSTVGDNPSHSFGSQHPLSRLFLQPVARLHVVPVQNRTH